MKKSQILAALALAFALGVAVIPTGSASAKYVKIDPKDGVSHIIDKDATDRVNATIQEAKDSCGWHMNGTTKEWYYGQYTELIKRLDSTAANIKNESLNIAFGGTGASGKTYAGLKSDYASTIGSLKNAIAKAIADGNLPANTTLPAGIEDAFTDDIETYDQAVKFVRKAAATFTTAANTSAPARALYDTVVTGGNLAGYTAFPVNGLNNLISTAETALSNYEATATPNIMSQVSVIRGETVNANSYKQAVEIADGLKTSTNGTCSTAKVRNLEEAIAYAENMRDSSDEIWSSYADEAIAAIKKAMNGGTITPEDVKKPEPADKNEGNKAPDTGILSTEDGGASTTVAMVAGVATALTAAGAGVVAYRNARRSSRK